MEQNLVVALSSGFVLEGRYVLGDVQRRTAGGIVYAAFDKKLRMMVEILEYIPADCTIVREESGLRGDEHFAEKKERILADGVRRMHSAQSDIYDVFPSGGTVYLVQVAPKNNVAPPAVPVSQADTSDSPTTKEAEPEAVQTSAHPKPVDENTSIEELAARTRVVEGLFPQEDSGTDDTVVSQVPSTSAPEKSTTERPVVSVAEDWSSSAILHDTPSKQPESDTQKTDHPSLPDTEAMEESAVSSGPSVKLLLGVLAAGVILLVICTAVFLTSLFRLTDLPGGVDSLLGVPYSEITEIIGDNWLVVGRAAHDGYAPGTVAAEEISDSRDGQLFRILINGHTPTYTMPELLGMTAEGARSLLAKTPFDNSSGFVRAQVTVEWVKDENSPHGAVIKQNPEAGSVTKTSIVTLTLAENTKSFAGNTISVPELVGKNLADMDEMPLLITDRVFSDKPAGEILTQTPAAGSDWGKNAPILVSVSLGEAVTRMPDVQFTSLADAEKALYGCGLSFTVTYAMNAHVQTGLVAEQSPLAGEILHWGDTVSLTVSGEGEFDKGPAIQTELTDLVLSPGDTWSLSLGEALTPVYQTSAPEVVSVTDGGLVTALAPGAAMLTASVGGQTLVVQLEVLPREKPVYTVSATVGEKLSLPALGSGDETGMSWYTDAAFAEVDALGNLTGKKAGTGSVWGIRGSSVSLYTVTLAKAETEKVYHAINKDLAKDRTKMENALKAKGLTCVIDEEYSDKTKGTVLQVKYTGYSDDTRYHIAEGTKVTLVISKGKPSVSSIAVDKKPNKLTYKVGEKINTTGLTLKVTYADKSVETVSSGYTVSYDFSSAGRKTVAVSYGQKKASFTVEVADNGPKTASVVSKPTKTSYTVGEKLNTAGLKVRVTYKDGTTKDFTSGFTTSYDFSKAGTKKVTVTVEGLQATFNVTVKAKTTEKPETTKPETTKPETKPSEKTLSSIRIQTKPTQTVIAVNGTVDTSGMVLTLVWSDGSTENVTSGWSISCDTSEIGSTKVNVTYQGKKTSYTLAVEEAPVTSVSIGKKPKKLTYIVGEDIDLTGMELAVIKGGEFIAVTWKDSGITWEADTRTVGTQTLTVYYGGLSVDIPITVEEADLTSLSIHTLPNKVIYELDEELDTVGMVLSAKYDDGSTRRVTEGYRCFYDFSRAGEARVVVTYGGGETSFNVTVVDPNADKEEETVPPGDGLVRVTPDSITLAEGESADITVYYLGNDRHVQLSYELDRPHVVKVTELDDGIRVTGTYPGTCVIRFSDGKDETLCVVTVQEKAAGNVTASMTVEQNNGDNFLPVLTFKGDGKEEIEYTFTATIRFDPDKLVAVDAGGMESGVSVVLRDSDVVVITGTVTIPKEGEVAAAYVFFFGSDTEAFSFEIQ